MTCIEAAGLRGCGAAGLRGCGAAVWVGHTDAAAAMQQCSTAEHPAMHSHRAEGLISY